MQVERRAADRIGAMLIKAGNLKKTYQAPPDNFIGFEGWVDSELFAEWRTQSLVVLRQTLGHEHQYTQSFEEVTQKEGVPSSVHNGIGVLRAVAEDLANGYLFDVKLLIEAEVFADFLEMAKHLVDCGYKDPAASLAGAVLEDGLRRIADSRGVGYKKSDGISALNDALAKAGAYNKLTQSKIDSWRHIRNSADHGNFGDYTQEDSHTMVVGITEFLGTHLT